MRAVSGLDIHKDSIFMCVLDEQSKIIEEKFRVSTCKINRLRKGMKSHYVSEVSIWKARIFIGCPFGDCWEVTSIYGWLISLILDTPPRVDILTIWLNSLYALFYLLSLIFQIDASQLLV